MSILKSVVGKPVVEDAGEANAERIVVERRRRSGGRWCRVEEDRALTSTGRVLKYSAELRSCRRRSRSRAKRKSQSQFAAKTAQDGSSNLSDQATI